MSTPISDGLVRVPMAYIYIRLPTIPYCPFLLGLTVSLIGARTGIRATSDNQR